MTKNIEICKAEEVGAQVLDIRTTAERQTVAAINAAFGLAIPLPANEPGEITELPAAVSAHDRQLLAQTLGKPEPAATLSTTDPLATFVATLTRELYRHLAERTADYLPADFPDPFARNLAHLLQAVQSLSPRKISNGSATSDGIKDGVSLARLVASSDRNNVTEIIDDTPGWEAMYATNVAAQYLPHLSSVFANVKKLTLGVAKTNYRLSFANAEEIHLPVLHTIVSQWLENQNTGFIRAKNAKVYADALTNVSYGGNYGSDLTFFADCKELYIRGLKNVNIRIGGVHNVESSLEKVVFDEVNSFYSHNNSSYYNFINCPKLVDIEFGNLGGKANCSINLAGWNPTDKGTTFLQNFRDHIALRLTDQGSGLTLTLSQAVRNAIHAAEATYGIEDIIVNQKHWTLSPAPSA